MIVPGCSKTPLGAAPLAKNLAPNSSVAIAYLLYSPRIKVNFSGIPFSTCYHRFTELIETYNLFPDISMDDEVAVKGTYPVPDTMLGGINHINFSFYNAVRQNGKTSVPGSNSTWFKNLTAAYVGCHNETENVRTLMPSFCTSAHKSLRKA